MLVNYEFTYTLDWCEIHLNSEHKIQGKQYDIELQCYFNNHIQNPSSSPIIQTTRAYNIAYLVLLKNIMKRQTSLNYQISWLIKILPHSI